MIVHIVKLEAALKKPLADAAQALKKTGEEYPHDKYFASCLVYGKTEAGRDLHVQVSLPPTVVIITAYEPDPEKWENGRNRR